VPIEKQLRCNAMNGFNFADNDESNYQAFYMRATVYLAMGKARSALPDLNQVSLLCIFP